MSTLRDRLRATPSVIGTAPAFDPAAAPEDPRKLFLEWLNVALDANVPEPHVTTLSTVDADGQPDARVLVLKDVTDDGAFEIATSDESAKGQQLATNPRVALSFYWTPLARSVRLRGTATRATPAESAADFLARHPASRAIALVGRQSAPLADDVERERLIAANLARVEADPELVSEAWTVWRIVPIEIQFWQGDSSRNHLRLRYDRTGDGWQRQRLWA
ncbi:pyridoxal 5'-phosphate synthase [Gryllotalpicola reticulitermitis]|uniref:Pyridoxal 5'-phosphate synthase n=1 Tax=Gryllotalpicola reticulitermitis TaxID=1184153 RepID=A0ABV8Q2R4_9MICO